MWESSKPNLNVSEIFRSRSWTCDFFYWSRVLMQRSGYHNKFLLINWNVDGLCNGRAIFFKKKKKTVTCFVQRLYNNNMYEKKTFLVFTSDIIWLSCEGQTEILHLNTAAIFYSHLVPYDVNVNDFYMTSLTNNKA
jgi:hypothetical protein